MAASSAAKDPMEEETTWFDCLEYFKDPVSFKGGHNFCRGCLTQQWEKSVTKETCCPLCRETVLQKNLRSHQQLDDIAEITKKLSLQGSRKTEGRERVCEKHQKPINPFCKNDETPICEMCERSKEAVDLASSAAKFIPIGDEFTCSVCLEYFKDPVTLECGHNFCRSCLTQFWEKSVTKKTSCPQCREHVQQRNLKSNWQLAKIIEITKKRPQGPRRAEGKERVCGKHQEPLKLFCKDDETPICWVCDKSKEHRDHTVIPMEEAAQDYKNVKSLLLRSQEKKTFEKPVALSEELKLKTWELYDLKSSLVPVVKQGTLLLGLELQKANVTLDPDTASRWLYLSEDRKSVRCEAKPQGLPDNPERFSNSFCVLGCEGFTTGRHSWEVVVENEEDWFVGVARKSVERKSFVFPKRLVGVTRDSVRRRGIGPSEGIWAVGKWEGIYCATSQSSSSVLSLSGKARRVRVCLNCAANWVAFYDADTGAQIHVFSDVPFSGETVLPFFRVGFNGHLRILP